MLVLRAGIATAGIGILSSRQDKKAGSSIPPSTTSPSLSEAQNARIFDVIVLLDLGEYLFM